MTVRVDIETRSPVDLASCGGYRYAADPRTQVLCLGYSIGDGPPAIWVPGSPPPGDLCEAIRGGERVCAWNAAGFELPVWEHIMVPVHGFPPVAPHQWRDTMAEAMALSLPGGLAAAANALRTGAQKDAAGAVLMRRLSVPVSTDPLVWREPTSDERARLHRYCMADVEAERAVARKLRPLSAAEERVWVATQRVNARGIPFDLPLVLGAWEVAERAQRWARERIAQVTDGAIYSPEQVVSLRKWCQDLGCNLTDLRAHSVARALADPSTDPRVREALLIRRAAGRRSQHKLRAVANAAGPDSRVRGTLVYHGARTGRWAGRLVQPQNFPRPTIDPTQYLGHLRAGDWGAIPEDRTLDVVASSIRATVCAAPGHRLVCGDYLQIEARVLAWLADERPVLDAFRQGEDPYRVMASRLFRKNPGEVSTDERHVGKVLILGAGYQMGPARFLDYAALHGIVLTAEEAETYIREYRRSVPGVVRLWRDMEQAAVRACEHPHEVQHVADGKVRFLHANGYLWVRLPSGRQVAYPGAKLTLVDGYPQVQYYEQRGAELVAAVTYGGRLTENVVQGVARDVLADAFVLLEEGGYCPIFTVHDEIVLELPESRADRKALHRAMTEGLPAWTRGLPVSAETWEDERYS
ncbi:MAG: DNA polymerase [Armatimonadota bacterium]|nr:DNA polymerase [Armatimonadota bacterium]